MKIDVNEVKRKILEILEKDGPNIPLPLARKVQMEPLFVSAILSELMNEKRIKISSLKVGSSPIYFLPGQDVRLEKFTENLTGAEKEAYLKLKDNKILDDESQEPKIRVALRSIKDFAIPIQINNKLHWKYISASEDKIKAAMSDEGEVAIGERVVGQKIWEDIKNVQKEIKEKQLIKKEESEEKNIEDIFQKEEKNDKEISKIEEIKEKSKKIKKITAKDLFLEQVKEIFKHKGIEIIQLISYDKKQLFAKARVNVDKTCIIYFIDKKRPDEKDLMKAYKKSIEYKLPYYVMTQSEPSKKILDSKKMYEHLLDFGSVE